MRETRVLEFAAFRFDLGAERLWRGTETVQLTAKAFGVLRHLVIHTGQLVTKGELIEAVWALPYVSEAALTVCIGEIRRALGDTARTPQFLETVRGRGYRFCAPVTVSPPTPGQPGEGTRPPLAIHLPGHLVGRAEEMAQLQQCWAQAQQGIRQVVLITGEAGIGKTALVGALVAQIASAEALWLGHGQCIDHHGAGEAYLPLLAALGHLGRAPDGQRLVELLRQHAPSWLLHLPGMVPAAEVETLQRRAGGTTRERMLRELAEAVEVLTAERPLVLVLEDLHWSDVSTITWLAYVARRHAAARLLVLGTYRPVEAIVHDHPVRTIVPDLQIHGQCREMALDFLSEADVIAYLTHRCGVAALSEGQARFLHRRTTGNPLFLVTLVDAWQHQGVLRAGLTGAALTAALEAAEVGVPESLRYLIERQLEQLSAETQTLLEVASVAGKEFAVAAVAAGMDHTTDEVEAWCATLARRGQFVRACGTDVWPDGTVATRYGFIHDLYRETVYERIPLGRRVRWHGRIGERLEAGYGVGAQEVAAELAEHFLRGRDTVRAVHYLLAAGRQAAQRSAHQEALRHFTRGLELLTALPETPARVQQELDLQIALAAALIVTRGFAAPEVETVYTRARELCQQVGESPQLFPVLYGLRLFYTQRAEYQVASALGEQLLSLALRIQDPVLLLVAHQSLGVVLFNLGELIPARTHLEQGRVLYDFRHHQSHALVYGLDPRLVCLSYEAVALWLLGYPAQALQRSHDTLTLGQALVNPFCLGYALNAVAWLHQCRLEGQSTQECTAAALALAHEHGFPFWVAWGTILRGWALAAQGQGEEGIAQLRQGLTAHQATGSAQMRPHLLALLAEAYGQAGQAEAGLTVLTEALTAVDKTGERWWETEMYRLKGELLLTQAGKRYKWVEAEDCFWHALAVARRQQARALELRAAMSLARLWQQQGQQAKACELLTPIYGWFTEGFDTADLQQARALLAALQC